MNLFLGVLNLLPLPLFDGGRIVGVLAYSLAPKFAPAIVSGAGILSFGLLVWGHRSNHLDIYWTFGPAIAAFAFYMLADGRRLPSHDEATVTCSGDQNAVRDSKEGLHGDNPSQQFL